MLPPRKPPVMIAPARFTRKELEHLYARRSAIDELIQSLEEYDRFKARRASEEKQDRLTA
jgi:hypothetical protein